MKSLSAKPLVAAALAFGALAAASAAHARSDVSWSIGVHLPFGHVQPAPVYVQPQPVYVQSYPAYGTRYYYQSDYQYQRRGAWGDNDRDGVPNLYDRDSRRYDAAFAEELRRLHRAGHFRSGDPLVEVRPRGIHGEHDQAKCEVVGDQSADRVVGAPGQHVEQLVKQAHACAS